ncbi:MAG: sigma-70 family RNA polymerase sigma factor [Bacilli bacterium]|jgi:RNA polymerase sigma factor (sigma-70 family)|nr:sigma-70 family RNA polymerase sigma factor [Acholeplasmataceae bacterium]
MKDNYLLRRALKSNDEDKIEHVFETIYRKYSGLLLFVSLSIVKRREIAEDIVNDTFLKFYNNIRKINFNKNIKYWLVKTAKNASLDYLKLKKNQIELNDDIVLKAPDRSKNIDYHNIIAKFKTFLTEEETYIVVLRLIFKCTFKEIAKDRNVSVNTVSGKYRRSIEKIRKYYKGDR